MRKLSLLAGFAVIGGLMVQAPALAQVHDARSVARVSLSGSNANFFNVAASSASNVWVDKTLFPAGGSVLLHWNGAKWSTTPYPESATGFISAIATTSSGNAWAIGSCGPCGLSHPLILHWNGSKWSRVTAHAPAAFQIDVTSIDAAGPDNVWAAGTTYTSNTSNGTPLTLHWNGQKWTNVHIPTPAGALAARPSGVAVTSAGNAWTVGTNCLTACPELLLIQHWNGTKWQNLPVPAKAANTGSLRAVAATSATDAWAVGAANVCPTVKTCTARLVIARVGTKTWSKLASPPNPGPTSLLNAISETSPNNAWAVGSYCANAACTPGMRPLILHWNGKTWSTVHSPVINADAQLSSVVALSSTNAYAVGGGCKDFGSKCTPLLFRWNGHAWHNVGI